MLRNIRANAVWILSLSLILGSCSFLVMSPDALSVATGRTEGRFRKGDIVTYSLDHSRREVLGTQPDASGRPLYELAPVDDASLETIWVSEDDVMPAE